MPAMLTMVTTRATPAPAVLAVALLSLVYLTVSDIYALINYVGFATWVRTSSVDRVLKLWQCSLAKAFNVKFFDVGLLRTWTHERPLLPNCCPGLCLCLTEYVA